MAIPAVNLSFIGQPSSAAQGQIYNNNGPGPLSKSVIGTATFTLDGALTSATLNFIDGVQKIGQIPVVLGLSSVAAPVTIGGVANQAVYSSIGATGQLRVGQSVTFAGFTNAGNNGTFTINALTTSTIQVTNAGSVAETNPQGTVSYSYGPAVAAVRVTRAGVSDTAAANVGVVGASSITNTSCVVGFSAAGANGNTLTVAAEVIFAS